jgi:hypothetical protein
MRILGGVCAALVLGSLLLNGVVMLVSPRLWFAMPSYLALRGGMRPSLLDNWVGRLRVRGLGLILTTVLVWMSADFVRHSRTSLEDHSSTRPLPGIGIILIIVTCLGFISVGGFMALRPASWYQRFFMPGLETKQRELSIASKDAGRAQILLVRIIRVIGILLCVAALCATWLYLRTFWNS